MKKNQKENINGLAKTVADTPEIPVIDKRNKKIHAIREFNDEQADDYIPPRKDMSKADEIMSSIRIEIPKCFSQPVNGRIYVVDTPGEEMRTNSGIILPMKMRENKAGAMKDIKRYFVVAFDEDEIPPETCKKLKIGIEVNPLLPQEAEEWTLPVVVDWHTGNVFSVIHYTEIAGISKIEPEEIETKKES